MSPGRFSQGLLVAALLCLLLTACEVQSPAQSKGKLASALPVEVDRAVRSSLSARFTITGTLEATREVQIFNQEIGTIIELPFSEGDRVKEGDKLARLDDALIRAQLDKATATHKQAEVDLNRLTKLIKRNLASQDEVAQARTALELARAEEDLLRTRLNRTRIHAPFDGVVSQRNREPGDVVPLHSHILTVIDPASLRARIAVSELILKDLQIGTAVQLRIDALGDQRFPGTITRVHPTVDPGTRKGTVDVELNPVPQGALPGQLSRIEIESTAAPRLTVKFSAVRHDTEGEYVFLVNDDKTAQRKQLTSGHRFGDRIEVIDGLQENQRVVIKGFLGLSDGSLVEIVGQPSAAQK